MCRIAVLCSDSTFPHHVFQSYQALDWQMHCLLYKFFWFHHCIIQPPTLISYEYILPFLGWCKSKCQHQRHCHMCACFTHNNLCLLTMNICHCNSFLKRETHFYPIKISQNVIFSKCHQNIHLQENIWRLFIDDCQSMCTHILTWITNTDMLIWWDFIFYLLLSLYQTG